MSKFEASSIERKEAYVTMITSDDFCQGVEALIGSLNSSGSTLSRVGNTRPILVMYTDTVTTRVQDKIKKTGAQLLLIDSIPIPTIEMGNTMKTGDIPETIAKEKDVNGAEEDRTSSTEFLNKNITHVDSWIATGYSKLCLWKMGEKEFGSWEALIYIDADAVVLEDISGLFDKLNQHNSFIAAPDIFPPDKFNAGVMGIWLDPADNDSTIFSDMMLKIKELKTYDGGDTGFLNAYIPQWYEAPFLKQEPSFKEKDATSASTSQMNRSLEQPKCEFKIKLSQECRLPFRYNAQRTLHWLTHDKQPGYWEVNKPYAILHFSSSPKPWQVPDKKGELELIWWQCFMVSQVGSLLMNNAGKGGGLPFDISSLGF